MADARKPIISGNWKMHHNHFEAIQCVQKLHYRLDSDDHEAVEVTVHPPFTDIRSVQTVIQSDEMPIAIAIGTSITRRVRKMVMRMASCVSTVSWSPPDRRLSPARRRREQHGGLRAVRSARHKRAQ